MAGSAFFLAHEVYSFKGSPAEKVIIGVVGTNGRGEFLASILSHLPTVEVGYICDVDELVLHRTIAEITGKKPKGFKDVRKLLEEKDLDAVVIATPDHWHAPAALLAAKAELKMYRSSSRNSS